MISQVGLRNADAEEFVNDLNFMHLFHLHVVLHQQTFCFLFSLGEGFCLVTQWGSSETISK